MSFDQVNIIFSCDNYNYCRYKGALDLVNEVKKNGGVVNADTDKKIKTYLGIKIETNEPNPTTFVAAFLKKIFKRSSKNENNEPQLCGIIRRIYNIAIEWLCCHIPFTNYSKNKDDAINAIIKRASELIEENTTTTNPQPQPQPVATTDDTPPTTSSTSTEIPVEPNSNAEPDQPADPKPVSTSNPEPKVDSEPEPTPPPVKEKTPEEIQAQEASFAKAKLGSLEKETCDLLIDNLRILASNTGETEEAKQKLMANEWIKHKLASLGKTEISPDEYAPIQKDLWMQKERIYFSDKEHTQASAQQGLNAMDLNKCKETKELVQDIINGKTRARCQQQIKAHSWLQFRIPFVYPIYCLRKDYLELIILPELDAKIAELEAATAAV